MRELNFSVTLPPDVGTTINKRGGTKDVIPCLHLHNLVVGGEDEKSMNITITFDSVDQLKRMVEVCALWLVKTY